MSHEDTWHVTSRDVQVDAGVGRILRAVRDSGLEDNTLVYFTSDHGGDWPQLGDQVGHGAVHCGPRGFSRGSQLYEHLFCMFWASN